MLFKIYHNPNHSLYLDLPDQFRPVQIIRGALSSNNLAFSVVRSNTTRLPRSLFQLSLDYINDLPNHVVESALLQKFNCGANAFFLTRHFGLFLFIHFDFFPIVNFFFFFPVLG